MTDEAEPTERLMYYMGRRITTDKKLVHAWTTDPTKPEYVFWPKAKASIFSGCVIGRSYTIGKSWPTYWGHVRVGGVGDELATEWQVKDRAEYLAHSQKSVDQSPQLTDAVDLLSRARQGLAYNQRLAFDVWVLSRLQGGKVK